MSSPSQVLPTSVPPDTDSLCLVGAGNMGGAMLNGWLQSGRDPGSVTVIDPAPVPSVAALMQQFGVIHKDSAEGIVPPDLLVVAVKPQIMDNVLPGLASLVTSENALVSVAAGIPVARLARPFQEKNPRIIRAMPNTPAMVQRGITVCVAGPGVSESQRHSVNQVLGAIGDVEWVEDETLIDAVTGVSGSGPAYVFHLAEALAQAGEKAGLSPDLAAKLARATVSGAGELMQQSDLTVATLRENVTSPGGTTEAALNVLMAPDGFPALLERAVRAAAARSEELADQDAGKQA